jgi:hypothetical protein
VIGRQAISPSAKQLYGILRDCRAWRLARVILQRHKALASSEQQVPAMQGPRLGFSDEHIIPVLASTPLVGEGHCTAWAQRRQKHASQLISHAFQGELKTLEIESSPSFGRQAEGSACVG